jgi:hypothetical protein
MSATFGAPGSVVGSREVAAERRADAEDPQEVLGHVGARVAARGAVHRHVDRRAVEIGGHPLERLLLVPELLEVHREDAPVHAEERGARRIDEVHVHHPVGVREREPAQHDRIDHAELRGDGGDAEAEHEDRQRAEGPLLDEDAQPDPDVLFDDVEWHIKT